MTGITRLQSQNAKPDETEKPRPLRIRLRTEDMKIQILQNAKHLATSETNRNVHLKRDMTFFGENPGITNSRSSENEGRRREKNGAGLNRNSCLSKDVNSVHSSLKLHVF